MLFNSNQVLELAAVTKETLRHWKRALGPIADKDGRSEGYTLGEVLSLCVIARMVHDFDIPISRFERDAGYLFRAMREHADATRVTDVVCMTADGIRVCPAADVPVATATLIVQLAPLLERIALRLVDAGGTGPERDPNDQLLLFPGPDLRSSRDKPKMKLSDPRKPRRPGRT